MGTNVIFQNGPSVGLVRRIISFGSGSGRKSGAHTSYIVSFKLFTGLCLEIRDTLMIKEFVCVW